MIKNRIRNKLRSRTGASISFALLLFLICSVISIVVIVAASAASGRMSRMAELDQRYYAVTSAAELVKGMLDEKTVSVAEVTVSKTETTYEDGVSLGTISILDTTVGTTRYLVPDKTAGEISAFLTKDYVVDGSETLAENKPSASLSNSTAYLIFTRTAISEDSPRTLSLTSNVGETLAVAIRETLDLSELDDGSATLTLVLTNVSGGDDKNTLVLTFTADVKTTTGTKNKDTVTNTTATSYTVTTTTTLTETTTVTWHLTDVSTSEAES